MLTTSVILFVPLVKTTQIGSGFFQSQLDEGVRPRKTAFYEILTPEGRPAVAKVADVVDQG